MQSWLSRPLTTLTVKARGSGWDLACYYADAKSRANSRWIGGTLVYNEGPARAFTPCRCTPREDRVARESTPTVLQHQATIVIGHAVEALSSHSDAGQRLVLRVIMVPRDDDPHQLAASMQRKQSQLSTRYDRKVQS